MALEGTVEGLWYLAMDLGPLGPRSLPSSVSGMHAACRSDTWSLRTNATRKSHGTSTLEPFGTGKAELVVQASPGASRVAAGIAVHLRRGHLRRGAARPPPRPASEAHVAAQGYKALSRELVEDCEAFLAGQFLARAEPRSLAVPVWVWSNVLAHGSPDDIRETAAEGSTAPSGWRAARAYLAAELLELQARGRSLEQLQHDVLVPMELHFAARADARTWTPQRWAAAVRTSIDVYGGSSRL